MPSNQESAETLAKKHFGHELFDMCWNTKADQVPTVETPTATPSTKQHFGGQSQYDLCWDDEMSLSKVNSAPILEPATVNTQTVGVTIPLAADQYDMCWNDRPSALAVGYKADFDMCWGDSPLGGDGHLESSDTTALTINSVLLWAKFTPFLDALHILAMHLSFDFHAMHALARTGTFKRIAVHFIAFPQDPLPVLRMSCPSPPRSIVLPIWLRAVGTRLAYLHITMFVFLSLTSTPLPSKCIAQVSI
ncbi:hypothetical protein DFJ58DRAFT_846908 [Suillus subalutaceus]|uniref:uncharacterized protein n=1 Tax=Suillus subalutaceus TaxID=48586 RepID=UPI001B87B157|nr:uncharacterized protein DFJ58DRAFT_846908 [Suillus subalutaceus]KAG1836549.1 hypothetical protein DFJ58DRAFT_846908 [Suillus subalutaceus]